MTPQELQYVQFKIGNSFLKSFYPADYRVVQQTAASLQKIELDENKNLKTTTATTSKINIKLAKTIGLLQREIQDLLDALDSTQNVVYMVGEEIVDAEALEEAMQRTAGGFDLFKTWRQISRARRILRSRERRLEKQRVKLEKKAAAKAANEKAAAAANKAKAAAEENLAKTVKPKATAEAPKVGPEPLPVNKSLAAATDDFARAPSAASEGAFKAALKRTTDPKSILSALKSAKNSYVAFDQAATKTLSRILGSRLLRWGGLAAIVIIETWAGWEEYVLVAEAFEKGYISAALKNTLIRNIIAAHSVMGVASLVFGAIGAKIGAIAGAPALGIGALVGGILGGIIGGMAGAYAAQYFVEILLENKTFSDYFDDVIDAVSETASDAYSIISGDAKPQAQVSPATSIVPSAAINVEPEPEVTKTPQTVAAPVDPPEIFKVPEKQLLAGIVPAPVNFETPSLEPPADNSTDLNPGLVRDNIMNQLNTSDRQRMQPGSDTTVPDYSGETPVGSENKEMATLRTTSGLSYQVNKSFASNFDGFVKALEATGYQIKSIGGYANRNIDGSDKKSFHSVGAAIDINPKQNPVTYGNIITDLPPGVGGLAAQFGLGWGGSWSGKKKDTMHFSAASAERGAFRIDRNTGAIMAAQGGKIHPQEGGTLTLVAEAGEPEYIVPQSKVENFAHEMLAARPTSRNKTKKHTHVMIVPIYT